MNINKDIRYAHECPISGLPLFYVEQHFDVYDGLSTITTADGIYTYEKWPRDFTDTIYLIDSDRGFRYDNGWKEFKRAATGEAIFIDDPFLDDKLRRARVYIDTHNHLSRLKYERELAEGKTDVRVVAAATKNNESIPIVPMSGPLNMLFYLDYKYKEL